jgi:hypothetical protein
MAAVSNVVTRAFRIALVPTGINYMMRNGLSASGGGGGSTFATLIIYFRRRDRF